MSRLFFRTVLVGIPALLMALWSGCSRDPHQQQPTTATGAAGVVSQPGSGGGVATVTATLSSVEQLRSTRQQNEEHASQDDIVFSEQGRGVAYIAESNGHQYVVHNGRRGNPSPAIQHLRISPDGRRVAYSSAVGDYLVMISDGVDSELFVDVYDPVYSPDSRHVAYLAEGIDRVMRVMLDGKPIELAPNVVSANFLFTGDSGKLVYHIRPSGGNDARLIIYDLKSGKKTVKKCLDNPLVMSSSRERIAAIADEGGRQLVMDFSAAAPDDVRRSALYDLVKDVSLSADGKGVAFVAAKGGNLYLVANGREDLIPPDLGPSDAPVVSPDLKGAGVVLSTTERYGRRYVFLESGRTVAPGKLQYGKIKEPVYGQENGALAYVAMKDDKYFMVVNGSEGPAFDAVTGPRFSPDGKKLVYRAREGASRFVVVTDLRGKEQRRHAAYEMVFPTAFTADGRSVAYGVKEGNRLVWKVEQL